MDPLAVWGAVTGSIAVIIALRREFFVTRKRLALAPGVNYNVSRTTPGEVTHGWASVALLNRGGRPLAVERVGFEWFAPDSERTAELEDPDQEGLHLWERNAAIPLEEPIELPVDGPTRNVYTPLGPLIACGLNPTAPIRAFAVTAGGRWWHSPLQPLVTRVPPGSTAEQLTEGLKRLVDDAEPPPKANGLIWLSREEPFLPEP